MLCIGAYFGSASKLRSDPRLLRNITAGQIPANPAELLSSPRLHRTLRDLRDEYDFVFVDAPPMLAVSDPCILAQHTDGLLIVTRINKNTRSAVIRVRQMIQDQGIRVVGAVANGAIIGNDRAYAEYGEYLSSTRQTEVSRRSMAEATVESA